MHQTAWQPRIASWVDWVTRCRFRSRYVLRLRREIGGERHPDTITALTSLGLILISMKKWDQVVKVQNDVLRLATEVLNVRHVTAIKAIIKLSVASWFPQISSQVPLLLDVAEIAINEAGGNTHPLYPSYQEARALLHDYIDEDEDKVPPRRTWIWIHLGLLCSYLLLQAFYLSL